MLGPLAPVTLVLLFPQPPIPGNAHKYVRCKALHQAIDVLEGPAYAKILAMVAKALAKLVKLGYVTPKFMTRQGRSA